jgi:predicted AAA+ superfamily ATPase
MATLLGITGPIGNGKSTFTELLVKQEPSHAVYESREIISELADDFNHALSGELAFETTNDPIELINQSLVWFVEAINEKLNYEITWSQLAITRRSVATHPELFEKAFVYIKAAKQHPKILDATITAENKATYRPLLQWVGGYLITKISSTIWYDEIFRRIRLHDDDKNLVIVNGIRNPSEADLVRARGGVIIEITRPEAPPQDVSDVTERSRSGIRADITVLNNGTLAQLEAIAEKLWQDTSISKPAGQYGAA